MSEPLLAWHFVDKTLRDGRPIPVDGEMLTQAGRIIPCERGLHASVKLIDALSFAPGTTLCRVQLDDNIVAHGGDKHAASKRVILWRIDARDILLEFARLCAIDVIDLWRAPAVMRQFLETGDPSLTAAADAAYAYTADADAAADAAYAAYAASAAAAHAARAAAAYAAAARDAYTAAARAAAAYAAAAHADADAAYTDAAADADADADAAAAYAREKQNDRLTAMVMEHAATLGYA